MLDRTRDGEGEKSGKIRRAAGLGWGGGGGAGVPGVCVCGGWGGVAEEGDVRSITPLHSSRRGMLILLRGRFVVRSVMGEHVITFA